MGLIADAQAALDDAWDSHRDSSRADRMRVKYNQLVRRHNDLLDRLNHAETNKEIYHQQFKRLNEMVRVILNEGQRMTPLMFYAMGTLSIYLAVRYEREQMQKALHADESIYNALLRYEENTFRELQHDWLAANFGADTLEATIQDWLPRKM